MAKQNVFVCENQISLFDLLDEKTLSSPETAVSMFDGKEHAVYPLTEWMSRMLPQGEFFILVDKYTLVLCKNKGEIDPYMTYRYYTIGDTVYAATGVGVGEEEPEEDECYDED